MKIKKTNKKNGKKGNNDKKKRGTKKLMKMILEAIIVMISWYCNTMKMRNNSKSEHVGKLKSKQ